MRFVFYLFSILLFIFVFSCGDDLGKPIIEVSLPATKSPLYYNGDTMIISALITDTYPLKKIILKIKNQKDSIVYLNEFIPTTDSFKINEAFTFHVDNHSNFYMYFNAWNINNISSEHKVYIHVMP